MSEVHTAPLNPNCERIIHRPIQLDLQLSPVLFTSSAPPFPPNSYLVHSKNPGIPSHSAQTLSHANMDEFYIIHCERAAMRRFTAAE